VSYIGPLNQVVHLWRYDNLADMEKKRTARDADPAWGEFQLTKQVCEKWTLTFVEP
jgi:hypothetical protein